MYSNSLSWMYIHMNFAEVDACQRVINQANGQPRTFEGQVMNILEGLLSLHHQGNS